MKNADTLDALWQRLSTHLNDDSRSVVNRAHELAARAHEGQWRDGRDGEPYFSHPLRVALILAEEVNVREGDVLAMALLHDVLEDTGVEYPELRDRMGGDIANAVELLTKERAVSPSDRGPRDAAYFSNIINGGEAARLVKSADRLDNLRSLRQLNDPERWQKYVDETREHVLPIAAMTNGYLHQALIEMIA